MKSAFSLVELSIVLVILGLLTGGILAGQSLIRAAELRRFTGDIEKIRLARNTFRDKYFAMPGDMANATQFWGAADGNDGLDLDCYTSTAAGTCNGNGDSQIGSVSGTHAEYYRQWQHLNLAGLMEGNYSGTPGAVANGTTRRDQIGINLPQAPIRLQQVSGYALNFHWSLYGYNDMPRQNTLIVAPCCLSGGNGTNIEGLSVPTEALWNIDTKLDDGKPGFGFIRIYVAYGGAINTSNYNLAADQSAMPIIGMGL